jgi:CRISPR-associated exonuclease Cas4
LSGPSVSDTNITPSLLNAYCICPRKAWFQSRGINPEQDYTNISIGRTIDETSYKRQKKSISIDNMLIDLIEESEKGPVICEVKKSSAGKKAAIMQIVYYLYRLKEMGIEAKGRLLLPKERKRETVELNAELEEEIKKLIKETEELISLDKPPELKKTKFCRKCAYFEFCFT